MYGILILFLQREQLTIRQHVFISWFTGLLGLGSFGIKNNTVGDIFIPCQPGAAYCISAAPCCLIYIRTFGPSKLITVIGSPYKKSMWPNV
jgi:hypothetical protein